MDKSDSPYKRHDSGYDVYTLLDDYVNRTSSKSNFGQVKSKWKKGFMPSTLPKVFHSDDAVICFNAIRLPDVVNEYESEYILWLKDKKNPMNMKLLHPMGYNKLINATEKVMKKVLQNSEPDKRTPELLVYAWKTSEKHVILVNSLEQIDLARENEEQNKYILRFDIRQFYESFYLHILAWISHSDRNNAKIAWFLKQDEYWAKSIENAILNLQYRESLGLPIGSSLMRELAESFLICLDAQIIERIGRKKELLDRFKLIRSHDNYDVICSTSDSCNECAIVIVYLLREYGFTVNYEPDFTQPAEHKTIKLTSLLSRSLSVSLEYLYEHRDSMDYHKMLSYFVEVLERNGFLELKYKAFFRKFLLEHPASISDVLSLKMRDDCRNMIMDILIDNVQHYIYQGVTCQFICILENIRLYFNANYYNAVMTIMEKFEVIKNHSLVSCYIDVLKEINSPKSSTSFNDNSNATADTINLTIKRDSCKDVTLLVASDCEVFTLKSKIHCESGTLMSQKELRFNGKLLQNESVLASCGVINGSTLYFKILEPDDAFLRSVFDKLNKLIPERYLIDLKGLERKKIKKITVPANMKDLECLKLVVDALRYQIEAKLKEKVKYTEQGEKWTVQLENGSSHEISFTETDDYKALLNKLLQVCDNTA